MASKRIRHWTSLILVFTFVIGLTFPVAATSAKAAAGLTDISDHWAKDKITQWVQKGLVSGYTDGTFKPDKSITRAEFVTLVNKVLGFSEKAIIEFSDVTPTDWFYEEIAKAVKAGYISGYQDGTVKPNREISRQEAAVALCKALNLEIQGDVTEFTDKDAIPNWSRPYIGTLAAKGYMGGYPDGSFKAERHITRAETVTMLDKVLATLQISYDVSGVYGPEEGIETISQDVAVNVPGVTLRNMIIEGNLYLNEGIGEGDATLDNVTVKGITTVRGGGKDSIHLVNFTGEEIIVIKVGGKVRIVASGNTKVGELKLESGAHIEGNGIVSVTVLKSGEDIILDGAFENVIVEAKAKIEVLKGTTINNLKVNSKSDINLADGATVKDLTLEAAATITGKGTIEKAKINADGAKLETEPKKVELAKGVTTEIAGKEVKEDKTSSKSGGGGGGGGTDKPTIIKVQSVSLDKSSVTLAVYESVYYQNSVTLTATIEPDNATNKKVTWKSSNNGVATVTGKGLNATVNAVNKGQAIITVTTDDGGKTAECEVTVVAGEVPVVPVSAIKVTPEEVTLTVDETEQLTATVEPEDATDKTVTWTSSDVEVATVDANGLVTAVGPGAATITATTEDGSFEAICEVIVAIYATPETIVEIFSTAPAGSTIQLGAGVHDLSELSYITPANNLTIIGGTDVTVAGIRLGGLNQNNAIMPDNLTLKNIAFTGSVNINNNDVTGLTIDSCTFSNGAVVKIASTCVVDNLTIKDCNFSATGEIDKTSILVQGEASNVLIQDNTITGAVYNAIQLTRVAGVLTIDGNTISDTGSRAIRIATLEGAGMTITNNAMSDANNKDAKYEGEIVKIDGVVTDVTASGNTYNGEEVYFVDGFVRVLEVTPTTFQTALDNADDGTMFILEAGEYGTIYFRQSESKSQPIDVTDWAGGGDVERYREFNDISIVGTAGAKVDQITAEAMLYGTKIDQPHSNTEYMTDYLSSYIAIENLTIKNIEFTGNKGQAVRLQSIWGHSSINGLTIDGCTLTGKEEDKTAKESFLLVADGNTPEAIMDKTTNSLIMTTGRNNLTVKNCTVDNVWMPINVTEWHDIDICDNNFSSTGRNDIIITGTSVGDVNIIGNTLKNAAERSIRLNTITGNIIITDNIIENCAGREIKAEDVTTVLGTSLMHISASGGGTKVTLSGNTWNGLNDAAAVTANDSNILLESDINFTVN